MDRIWKNIVGYEGAYQISNYGEIKSLERVLPSDGLHVKCHRPERMLNPAKDRAGYLRVKFARAGVKSKTFSVHRLVAMYFISNPENKPEVNHKNGIKSDNRAVNLEWATRSENQSHAYATGLKNPSKSTRGGKWNSRSKPVLQIMPSGEVQEWEGVNHAAKTLKMSASCISAVCRGAFKQHRGFEWRFRL